jgi:large subunit ribosomal protein L15
VLGDGELSAGVTIKATAFSESAIQKIEAAGGTVSLVPKKQKWNRQAGRG